MVELGVQRAARRGVVVAAVVVVLVAAVACSSDDGDAAGGTDGGADPVGTTAPVPAGGAGEPVPLPERFEGYTSEVYADPGTWLCRPDLDDDACDLDLDTTVIAEDGSTEVVEVQADPEAPVDCFYVYPTVNPGPGAVDEAMAADTVAEDGVAAVQLAQMGQVCRLWAPLYRQITFAGFGAEDAAALSAQAYEDVRDAFAHYLANGNDGRPIVLMGHSQGSGILAQLLAEEFDGDPAMTDRLVSALLVGGRATVAEGGGEGGSFTDLPPCTAPDQVHCVVAWNTVGEGASDTVLATWGGAEAGEERLCTNPAALGGGPAPLHTIVESSTDLGVEVTTPYVALDGAVTGECTTLGGARVLLAVPTEGWPPGDLAVLTTNVDFWGLHIVDVSLALGDLIDLVRTQSAAVAG